MKIIVCIKQVPDTETKIKISGDGSSIDSSAVKWIMNPYDEYAVEEAVKLKEKNPQAVVHVLTLGPKKRAGEALRTALAMGADEGILIDNEDQLTSAQIAKLISNVIKSEGGANLVLCGKLAIDSNQSAVPQMLAEFLSYPHVSVVSKLEINGENTISTRDIEGGAKEIIEIKGPVVISANKGLNTPRYASLPGIMKAKKKTLKEITVAAADCGFSAESVVTELKLPPEKNSARLLSGEVPAQVKELVRLLRDESKVL